MGTLLPMNLTRGEEIEQEEGRDWRGGYWYPLQHLPDHLKDLHNFFPSLANFIATDICNKREAIMEETLMKILVTHFFTLAVLDIL